MERSREIGDKHTCHGVYSWRKVVDYSVIDLFKNAWLSFSFGLYSEEENQWLDSYTLQEYRK